MTPSSDPSAVSAQTLNYSVWSILSLVCALVSVFSCFCFSAYATIPLALTFGVVAHLKFDPAQEHPSSKKMAKISMGVALLATLLVIAFGVLCYLTNLHKAGKLLNSTPASQVEAPRSSVAPAQPVAVAPATKQQAPQRDAAKAATKRARDRKRWAKRIKAREAEESKTTRASSSRKRAPKRRVSRRRAGGGTNKKLRTQVITYTDDGYSNIFYY